ncbi:MAG: HAD family hydrolase [Myxococcaceae bacterium]|nr:HAD family hydrolase [Myxococcaceae bacterium]
MAPPFEAVIFDLDGTLADTLDDIADATNAALRASGQPEHPRDRYKLFVGAGVENLARAALPPDRMDLVADVVRGFREHYSAHIVDRSRPFPEIPAALDALVARGIRMAVLSNKVDALTKRIVGVCFSKWPIDPVFGERAGVPKKPDPAAALEIARHWGRDPSRIAFVGDTGIDMRTSVNAGMRGIGVLWGFRPREELEAEGAWRIVATPAELVEVLTGATVGRH